MLTSGTCGTACTQASAGSATLRHCRSHLTAGLSATAARRSTALAVVAVMFLALTRTAIAGFGANATHLSMNVGIAGHETGAECTGISTIPA